jgi:hypothetical protein
MPELFGLNIPFSTPGPFPGSAFPEVAFPAVAFAAAKIPLSLAALGTSEGGDVGAAIAEATVIAAMSMAGHGDIATWPAVSTPATPLSFVDPGAATFVLAPGWCASSSSARPVIIRGAAEDFAFQCWNRGGRTRPVFAMGDALSAAIYQWKVPTPICEPAVGWYTAGGIQTGYDQGQVVVSPSNADTDLLQPTGGSLQYTLVVTWTPAVRPSKSAPIVRLPLTVKTDY